MDSPKPGQVEERYVDVHEAAGLLDISEKELWDLVHKHEVPTHNIAGAFLRFRKADIEHLKNKWRIERDLFPEQKEDHYFAHRSTVRKAGIGEKIADFWYFNDYYLLCTAAVFVLLYFIVSSQ